jgi:hypothetical protein
MRITWDLLRIAFDAHPCRRTFDRTPKLPGSHPYSRVLSTQYPVPKYSVPSAQYRGLCLAGLSAWPSTASCGCGCVENAQQGQRFVLLVVEPGSNPRFNNAFFSRWIGVCARGALTTPSSRFQRLVVRPGFLAMAPAVDLRGATDVGSS